MERAERINKAREIHSFIETLRDKPESITEFDEDLWITLVEKVEVSHDQKCAVYFKNEMRILIDIMLNI